MSLFYMGLFFIIFTMEFHIVSQDVLLQEWHYSRHIKEHKGKRDSLFHERAQAVSKEEELIHLTEEKYIGAYGREMF